METRRYRLPVVLGLMASLAALSLAPELAGARTIRVDRGIDFFPGSTLANDGSVAVPLESRRETANGREPVPFSINFFGTTYDTAFINENGFVSFGQSFGGRPGNTDFAHSGVPMIAGFFADADMSQLGGAGTGFTEFAFLGGPHLLINFNSTYQGQSGPNAPTANFQIVITDVSGITGVAGDFNLELNYNELQWETGDTDGGTNGLGGMSGRVGFTDGSGLAYEIAGSGVPGALLNPDPAGPPTAFCNANPLSVGCNDYFFQFRGGLPFLNGVPLVTVQVPAPSTLALLGLGLFLGGVVVLRRRRLALVRL